MPARPSGMRDDWAIALRRTTRETRIFGHDQNAEDKAGPIKVGTAEAKLALFGTIFVPIRDGISHSPKEFASWKDIANGAEDHYR